MSPRRAEPIGAILAGGLGRRIGGAKAVVELAGRPLISYPLAAMQAALKEVAIVAKPATELPDLPGCEVWIEPPAPQHPLVGILEALAMADGRPVLVCAADLPLVTPETIRRLADADPAGAPAVIAAHAGAIHPLLGCYHPAVADLLGPTRKSEDRPLRQVIASIGPRLVQLDDPDVLFNVNAPEDLVQAASMLDARPAQPNVKS